MRPVALRLLGRLRLHEYSCTCVGGRAQIAKQLCRGLGAIHQSGILHRDMKPENVMVLPNGNVKLMDFGIAEVIDDNKRDKSKVIVGTPRYMSPEQLRNEPLDGRSDLYAAGMILYEMFTGRALFTGKSLTEIVQRKVIEDPAAPRDPDPSESSGRLRNHPREMPAGRRAGLRRDDT